MISQTEPHGGEVFIASLPFFVLIPKIFFSSTAGKYFGGQLSKKGIPLRHGF